MRISVQHKSLKATVDATLDTFSRRRFRCITFPKVLEERFEQDTRQSRSYRMWFEGLIAIVGFNICLLIDYLIVKDSRSLAIVLHTAFVTPLALVVNILVRTNPPRLLREGSIAVGMFGICLLNLIVEGRATTASTLFGAICVLITALFVGVVMRLRFLYVFSTLLSMLIAGVWTLGHARPLHISEAIMADSMLAVGIIIILVASLSLEFEERNGYLVGLQRNLQAEELAWANQALRELSNIDNLTRLPNRRALDERVTLFWKSCAERNEPISAVIIDVDHFKLVNDAHGHLFGDEILRLIADILPQALRSSADMVARFGGEEFVLLLPNATPRIATSIAEQARHLVASAPAFANPEPDAESTSSITVSCGVSTVVPGGSLQWKNLIASADEALYRAKRGGRNRVEFCRCVEPSPTQQPETEPTRTPSKGRLIIPPGVRRENPISNLIARL